MVFLAPCKGVQESLELGIPKCWIQVFGRVVLLTLVTETVRFRRTMDKPWLVRSVVAELSLSPLLRSIIACFIC